MGIVWSGYSGGLAVGIDVSQSPATVSSTTSSVNLTVDYYVRAQPGWTHNSWGTLSFGGAFSGSHRFAYNNASGGHSSTAHPIYSRSITVGTVEGASVSRSFNASVSGWWNGASPSVSASHTVPARPVSSSSGSSSGSDSGGSSGYSESNNPYYRPSSVTVTTNSDRSMFTVSWTGGHGKHLEVDRKLQPNGKFTTLAKMPTGSGSFVDRHPEPDSEYKYTVWGIDYSNSPHGESSDTVFTRPHAPTNVRAVRVSENSIRIAWDDASTLRDRSFEVYDNGLLVGSVASSPFTHTNVQDVHHSYTVKTVVRDHLGKVLSAPSAAVEATLLTRPHAPVPVAVLAYGITRRTFPVRWTYSNVDETKQTRYQVRYKKHNAQAWTTLGVSVSPRGEHSFVFPQEPDSFLWQVRVWGDFKPGLEDGASEWSQPAVVFLAEEPVLALTSPPRVVDEAQPLIQWNYYDANDAQPEYVKLELLRDDSLVESLTVSDSRKFTGGVRFNTVLENGVEYEIRARAYVTETLTSNTIVRGVRAEFPPPAPPVFNVSWDELSGSAYVEISGQELDGRSGVVSNSIYRKTGDGVWELIVDNHPPNTVFIDRTPPIESTVYKVVASTRLGAAAYSEQPLEIKSDQFFLNAGNGWEHMVAFKYEPELVSNVNLHTRAVHYFAGRSFGVEFSGRARRRTISFSAEFEGDRKQLESEEFFFRSGPFLYRDPRGARFLVSVTDASFERLAQNWWRVSVECEQVSA